MTKIIDGKHFGVKLTDDEKRIIYTWMDINAPYYPVYESAYPDNLAGRSPLTDEETKRLKELTGVDFHALNDYRRKVGPQISFERPEVSPCLDKIRDNVEKYVEAVALIRLGGERLKIIPNGSLLEDFIPCQKDIERLLRYANQMKDAERFVNARNEARKEYDKK